MKIFKDNEIFKTKLLFTLGTIFMLILVIGATYAYFDMTGVFDETKSLVKGKTLADSENAPIMITENAVLKMNITNTNMAYPNVGKKFYATPSGTLVPESEVALDNGRYILSTISVNEEELTYDCNIKFVVSATLTNEVNDGSSDNVVVTFTDNIGNTTTYTLTEILENDRVVLGTVYGIDNEKSQNYYVEAYVLNTETKQEDLINNPFTINVLPVKSADGFQCESYTLGEGKIVASLNQDILTTTITNGTFESDKYCINNSATNTSDCTWNNVASLSLVDTIFSHGTYYAHVKDKAGNIFTSNSVITKNPSISISLNTNKLTITPTRNTFELNGYCINTSATNTNNCTWNTIGTSAVVLTPSPKGTQYVHLKDNASGITNSKSFSYYLTQNLMYDNGLWKSGLEGDGYRFIGSGTYNSTTTPSNYICFGTTDKTECKNNETKYMYRIIGVFPDSSGGYHIKLIKYKDIGAFVWNSSKADIKWGDSELYTGLNGSTFLTNTTYDYLQNNVWLNKIEDWTWSAVHTNTYNSGPDYSQLTSQQIYLNEMNRSGNTATGGDWTTPTAKIGLMYLSDYFLALGNSALNLTNSSYSTLQTGWLFLTNNNSSYSSSISYTENTMAYRGYRHRRSSSTGKSYSYYEQWVIYYEGSITYDSITSPSYVRPVFYLTTNQVLNSGSGTYADPYIIAE